jgi:hypothetical protein
MAYFPRQDIPLSQKNEVWLKSHLDYAESLLKGGGLSGNRQRMSRFYNAYNGVKTPGSLAWLEKSYGKQNKAKYIAYRLGRTKISLLHGEFLKRPLTATVTTINSEAKFAKMQQVHFMTGAMLAKKEIEDIKNKAGIDLMNGVPVPENENDPIWERMAPKDKQEDIMQIILDEQVKSLDLKKKLGDCFMDVLIASMCYCKIEINQDGDVEFHRIDPRDAIFEEIEGDDYMQKSPIMGARQVLPVHEILLRYNLTKDQRDLLNEARMNPDKYTMVDGPSRGFMRMGGGELLCDIIHIEWDSVEAEYTKIAPKTKNQMLLDSSSDTLELAMDAYYYEDNKDAVDKDVASGKYKVVTKYRTVKYEATRIGGIIDVNMRKRPFQARSMDNPSGVLNRTYHGFLCGTVDGVRISLQQIIENFDNLYDIVMYQINRDIARAKGKALFYDRAGLPEGKSMKDVMYQVLNDGYIDWNSAASGNYSMKNLEMVNAIREVDLGLSQSFEYLTKIKQQIVNDLNQITGINENRQGDIAASSTATNANSAIQASRTITEPIFFGFNGFVSKVMQTVVDSSAVSWAFYKTEKGDQILGTEKHKYLRVTKELGFRDYGVHIEDGGKYAEIKQMMNRAMEISLNAKEIRPIDYYKVNMAETLAQAKSVLENSWEEMQKAIQKSNEANNQLQAQIAEAKLKQQIELAREDREDRQLADENLIIKQGEVDIVVNREKAKDKMAENQQKADNEFIMRE